MRLRLGRAAGSEPGYSRDAQEETCGVLRLPRGVARGCRQRSAVTKGPSAGLAEGAVRRVGGRVIHSVSADAPGAWALDHTEELSEERLSRRSIRAAGGVVG